MLKSKAKWEFLSEEGPEYITESHIMDILLQQRGITTEKEAAKFIAPDLNDLLASDQLYMIDRASQRIHEAILNEEKILIYGDYDADGVCSTALLLKTLNELEARCDFYIPNRFTEGYGPNQQAFQWAYDNDFHVIITVDTGIASHKEVDFASKLGMDIIITDHHDIQEDVPNAYATIHPAHSPQYEFKQLAGVGVAFKFAEHLLGYFPNQLLDLVAIGTITDLVPLIGENRIFAKYGLQALSQTKNKGLIALKKVCNIEGNVTEEDVGFRIGPRLNAVGRLQDADLAVDLLMTGSNEEAKLLVEKVQNLNEKRQQIVRDLVKEADAEIDQVPEKSVLVVAKPSWNEGVLGIVASRLVQKYHCPTIVLSINEETNEAKGSARSIPAFHLFDSCMQIRDLFTAFGGHSQAAGMTLPVENIDLLRQSLNKLVRELDDENFQQIIEISKTISVPDVNEQLIEQISQLAPFGMENPKPVFHLKETPRRLQQIGRDKDHLKLQFEHEKNRVEGIGFNMGDVYGRISPQAKISLVGELGINEWNGFRTVQMIIEDLQIDEWQLFDHRGRRDFNPKTYIQTNAKCIFLSNNVQEGNDSKKKDHITYITYETDLQLVPHAKQLFIYDIPNDIQKLEQLIMTIQPEQIHACYRIKNSVYLQSFPTREEFKWLYALLLKKETLDIKEEIPQIMNHKGWSKDQVIFMLHVFKQLQFITSAPGKIIVVPKPAAKDLHESQVYLDRQNQAELEKVLYFSTYDQLKQLFSEWIGHHAKEEVSYGL